MTQSSNDDCGWKWLIDSSSFGDHIIGKKELPNALHRGQTNSSTPDFLGGACNLVLMSSV